MHNCPVARNLRQNTLRNWRFAWTWRLLLTIYNLSRTPCATVLLLKIPLKTLCTTVVLFKIGDFCEKAKPCAKQSAQLSYCSKLASKHSAQVSFCFKLGSKHSAKLTFCLKLVSIVKNLKFVQNTVHNCPVSSSWRQNTLRNCHFAWIWRLLLKG